MTYRNVVSSLAPISLISECWPQARWNSRIIEKDVAGWVNIVGYFSPRITRRNKQFYEAMTLFCKMKRMSSEPSASSPSSVRRVRTVFCNDRLAS